MQENGAYVTITKIKYMPCEQKRGVQNKNSAKMTK